MIEITRFNGSSLYINPELILSVEQTPDTVITMTNGDKFVVKESVSAIVERFMTYKRATVLTRNAIT